MHPLDTEDRREELREAFGVGYCNITKCCTRVCPESIAITDNAIIPLKERVVDGFYDPLRRLFTRGRARRADAPGGAPPPGRAQGREP
jgi:succinate dehydrogenase / fumarate reductase iron-sulfur subunit